MAFAIQPKLNIFYFRFHRESSVEQVLPDSLFASPTKSAGEHITDFSTTAVVVNDTTTSPSKSNSLVPMTSAGNMASNQ